MKKFISCYLVCALSALSVFGQTGPTCNTLSCSKSDPIVQCMGEIIDSCFLTTSQDCDNDRFASSRWLVVDMFNAAPIASAYIEVWIKTNCGDQILFTTNTFTLPRTRYGFELPGIDRAEGAISVRVINAADNILADAYEIAGPIGFETTEQDFALSVAFCDWYITNAVDADGDNYYSFRSLQINLNGCPDTRNIYVVVSVCKQPVPAGPCEYSVSSDFHVDKPFELHSLTFGDHARTLTHGEYQVTFQAYDAATDEPLTPWYVVETNAKFELPSEDVAPDVEFSISDIFMGDEGIDLDHDGYYRSRDLNFTVRSDSGVFDLTGKIFERRLPYTSDFPTWAYKSIPEFEATPAGNHQKVIIDSLPGYLHDFKILLYHGTEQVTEVLPEDSPELNHQKFESDQ